MPPESRDSLLQQARQLQQQITQRAATAARFLRGPENRAGESTAGQAALRGGVNSVVQNASNLITAVPNMMFNEAKNFANLPEMFGYERTTGSPSMSGPLNLAPTAMAGIDMMGESVGAIATKPGFHSQNPIEASQVRTEGMRADHPISFGVGDIAGDVASLLALRSPAARQRGQAQWDFRKATERAAIEERTLRPFAPSVSNMFRRLSKNSTSLHWLQNRAGRAVEAGIEGAAMGVMNSDDPVETAMWSAGVQLGGGVGTQLASSVFSGGPLSAGLKLSLAAAGTFGILFGLKQAVPGEDMVWKTLEDSYEKVAAVLGLGLVSGVAGAGRITNPNLTAAVADQITAALRGVTQSVLTESREDGRIETVLDKVRVAPGYFGRPAMLKLESVFSDPTKSMTMTIDELMENDPEFRRKYLQLEKAQ